MKPPCLLYEYMENGSLHDQIHNLKSNQPLDWNKRSKILKGACRGLTWLHSNAPPLVHQDIKSSNVLIDSNYCAKLGDFGFSLEMPSIECGRTVVTSPFVAFTQGYCPPEITDGHYSPKSDVYSYGIVMLETYTGLLPYDQKRDDEKINEHLDEQLQSQTAFKLLYDKMAGEIEPYLAQLYFRIIKGCIIKHSKRSHSKEVMQMWEETNY